MIDRHCDDDTRFNVYVIYGPDTTVSITQNEGEAFKTANAIHANWLEQGYKEFEDSACDACVSWEIDRYFLSRNELRESAKAYLMEETADGSWNPEDYGNSKTIFENNMANLIDGIGPEELFSSIMPEPGSNEASANEDRSMMLMFKSNSRLDGWSDWTTKLHSGKPLIDKSPLELWEEKNKASKGGNSGKGGK